jgi:uncharacterized protein YsxB (DUF464 family)
MVRVRVYRNQSDRTIRVIIVEGHADFATRGKDLVCAGVSSVTVGTYNAIAQLLGIELVGEMESGRVYMEFPRLSDETVQSKLQLLAEAMIQMLLTIQNAYGDYGKYIEIEEMK